ncbi:MAG: peptidoglycan-binding protein, partial [Clostridia bacterium]|nr:peptidoglycan-binding protein [Clostridia bacterium]
SPTPKPTPTPTPEPILHRGVESDRVLELQTRLMELGYMDTDVPTRLFGPATERAVELFQRQINYTEALDLTIDEDGWAGDQTLSLLYSADAPKYCVKEGMSGDDVSSMQMQLVDMGYMSKTTGYYGDETKAAMKEFQSRNGLSADGLAGEKTYEMLYSPDAKESKSKAQQARTKANISKMIEVAKSKLGCRYILGNTGPNSFDCSGLVYYCLKQAGSNRRRLTAAGYSQVSDWEKITSINSLKKGDLICFYNDGYTKVGHIGIVVSSGMMIDASSSNGKVVRRSYTSSYWKSHFVCGRRPW